jgi:hypothetical protein
MATGAVMKPEPAVWKPLGYRIAIRPKVKELCELCPERAEEFWAKFKSPERFPLDEYNRILAEVKRPKIPAQPIEVARKVTQQAIEQLAAREDEEARRCREEKNRELIRMQRQAALDAFMERQLAEREIAQSWSDPCGNWGRMTLASPLED